MNVNLAEHQRSIMAAMGIDLWVPKVNVQTRQYQSALYRDVVRAEAEITAPIEFSNPSIHSTIVNTDQNIADKSQNSNKLLQSEVSLLKRNNETQKTEEISKPEQIQKQTEFNNVPAIQIQPFEIQAFCNEDCLILVDYTDLNADQKTLWINIQRSVTGQYYELKWPFPMLQFQDGKGAAVYIQGFVDALKQERKIISLGQLSHLKSSDVIQLASLQEMLDQPILKRRLWQFMQK